MAETALNFGPDWIRALAAGSTSDAPPPTMPIPRYKLAEYRYGREEMLALIPKDTKVPESVKQFEHLAKQNFQIPLALTPMTEDEQILWSSRYVNSEASLRGKSGPGGYGMNRTGRGGSVDRGRGRGRGGYYQRGSVHEDLPDGPPFPRQKTIERSLSANEKDHRWDERDRRYDRTFSGRGGIDDTNLKHDNVRAPNEHWRKFDKEDEGDWRANASRSYDKLGGRGSWRNSSDRERRDVPDRNNAHNRNSTGSTRGGSHGPLPRHSSWKEDSQGNNLPEWSVEEVAEPDTVGTFDSSGAFLETKPTENNTNVEEIYASDDADEGSMKQDSPEAKKDSSKKTTKKPSTKPSANKKNTKTSSDTNKSFEETPAQNASEPSKSPTKTTAGKSRENLLQQTAVQKQSTAQKDPSPPRQQSVRTDSSKPTKVESVLLSNVKNSENCAMASEEDAFAYHQKATENMVAQWTEEIEQRVTPHNDEIHQSHPEQDVKWFYQDPQGDVQGPFTSNEMLEWFSSGYFTMSLMVRRHYDETFSQLGELIKAWGRVPFMPGSSPPPLRVTPLPPPISAPIPQPLPPNLVSNAAPGQLPKPDEQLIALQQQLFQQQLMQQQLMLRQAQMQQILSQLKQQDNFNGLSSQQQQQILMQQFMAQMPRPNMKPMGDQSSHMDPMNPLSHPLMGLPLPPMMKSDSLWQTSPEAGPWPVNTSQPPGGSIWDVDLTKPNSEISELEKQKKLIEEQERLRKSEEFRLQQEMEEKRKEELRRKHEEEEEHKRIEEIRRQEAERQLKEELKRLEDMRKEEEKRQEELKRQQEELRKQEELRRQEEKRKQDEEKRLEELRVKEERRKMEEAKRLQELKKMEEKKKKEEMMKKQLEKEREKQLEIERQKEALRQKELEREERLLREKREREELEMRKLAELKIKTQGPVWGIQKAQNNSDASLSLADIQRLQEEKEREEKEEKMRQQLLQQQAVKQVQINKNGLTWAKRANDYPPVVKSLSEIQQEEAERLAQLSRMQKPQAPAPTVNSNAGVWGNSSHLNKITAASSGWNNASNNLATTGFWDDALNSTTTQITRKQPVKSSDNSFPSLANPAKPAVVNNSKTKNARAKKEEDAVSRLFGSHRKPTDEFTKWCTEAISAMPSSVDVPTFVAFLKDIESPYEVHDYVKSYFGEGKEPKEFATLFLEKRSKYRNQAKQAPAEDNSLWGPAPAITPTVNKPVIPATTETDGNSGGKGKAKKKKGKMQKLDNSMLGFTVQPNPDRINAGEIDHIENNM